MKAETVKIKCETEGFEEATEEVETLAKAYDSFPSQVQVRNCHDCTINIYPSQTKYVEVKGELPEHGTDCPWG
jgi:hypothetical protein